MYEPRQKVFYLAILSRVAVFILQFLFNLAIPDHDADAFRTPTDPTETVSVWDNATDSLLGGLAKWDGQYFLHIAKYGYTYENTLAFYPLYPSVVRIVASVLGKIFFALNVRSTLTIAAVLVNFVCFVKSAVTLYDLSKCVFSDRNIAYRAAILYCVNPASVFFSAAYSESMFAYLTFYTMFASIKNNPCIYLPLGLSTIVRSNGLVNFLFPLFFRLRLIFKDSKIPDSSVSKIEFIRGFVKAIGFRQLLLLLNIIVLSLAPFVLLQIYNYLLFCVPELATTLPHHVTNFGIENNLIFPGNGSKKWCEARLPLAYTYVQSNYWNVGFLRYYEFKQIPNFVLAFPVLYVVVKCAIEFFKERGSTLSTLGLSDFLRGKITSKQKKYPMEMFVFVLHGCVLFASCVLFVHIQVSTRLLCSATPLVYWYCALSMSQKSNAEVNDSVREDTDNAILGRNVFFARKDKFTVFDKWILFYFGGYFVIGCLMFPNFLPWT